MFIGAAPSLLFNVTAERLKLNLLLSIIPVHSFVADWLFGGLVSFISSPLQTPSHRVHHPSICRDVKNNQFGQQVCLVVVILVTIPKKIPNFVCSFLIIIFPSSTIHRYILISIVGNRYPCNMLSMYRMGVT
jgi:DMSO reductase anchor subunit